MTKGKSLAGELAQKICRVQFSDFPASTVHKAKLHLLDTIGAGLAGSVSPETQRVWRGLGLCTDAGRAAVWGTPHGVGARSASFINGVSAHALELDDSGGCDHSGAVVVPASLAILPQLRQVVSGQRLLAAILMGYEVGRRVLEAAGGYETHNGLGWHSTGTCGVFGAAAATGLLLDLDASGLEQALGISCSFASGTWAFIHDGSQTKKLHPGRAAEGGLSAALLAASEFTGPVKIFDAEVWGSFFKTFSPAKSEPGLLTEGFGKKWRLDRCSIKPYATCRGTHSAIDAVRQLRAAHRITTGQIAAVEVEMSGFQFGMCGGNTIASRAQAQMSLPYAIAAELQFGKVGPAELEPQAWSSQAIQTWLDRIVVGIDPVMADEAEPAVTLVTKDAQRLKTIVEFPYGSPANPLSDDQLIAKFRDLAGAVLSGPQIDRIENAILGLDAAADVRDMPSLLKRTE
ncbi:MAG TPA: MmgE/PrpD family protein [Rhizomicrobium sp.]